MSGCNDMPTRPSGRLYAALRTGAVLAGALVLAAGCVPVGPGYGGYESGPAYAPGPVYAPGYGYAPEYGYGGGVVVYGGGGGHYDGRDYHGRPPPDHRAGGYRPGGDRPRPGNDHPQGGHGGAPPAFFHPEAHQAPGGAGPARSAPSRPAGGGHDRRDQRP